MFARRQHSPSGSRSAPPGNRPRSATPRLEQRPSSTRGCPRPRTRAGASRSFLHLTSSTNNVHPRSSRLTCRGTLHTEWLQLKHMKRHRHTRIWALPLVPRGRSTTPRPMLRCTIARGGAMRPTSSTTYLPAAAAPRATCLRPNSIGCHGPTASTVPRGGWLATLAGNEPWASAASPRSRLSATHRHARLIRTNRMGCKGYPSLRETTATGASAGANHGVRNRHPDGVAPDSA